MTILRLSGKLMIFVSLKLFPDIKTTLFMGRSQRLDVLDLLYSPTWIRVIVVCAQRNVLVCLREIMRDNLCIQYRTSLSDSTQCTLFVCTFFFLFVGIYSILGLHNNLQI